MKPRILIAGVGNLFRGDDAFGSEVARRLAAAPVPPDARVVDFGIRGFDLACALFDGYDGAILVDALQRGYAPGTLCVLEPDLFGLDEQQVESPAHGLHPLAVFRLVRRMGGQLGCLRVVGCEPATFGSEEDPAMGLSPPVQAAVAEAVRLVEQEKVLCTHNTLGTACNTAIHKYMNQKKVPQLFVATGASKWGNPKDFPWTMGYQPDYHTEAVIYAKHILSTVKDAKIGVLMQNDDYGKDYYEGMREGLGKEVGRIVKHVTYEVTDPTVDSQVIQLKDSGANVFFNISIPKFAAQSMRKAGDIGWKPVIYLNNVSSSVASAMKPAGITSLALRDPPSMRPARNGAEPPACDQMNLMSG